MYRNIDECLTDVYRFGAFRIEPHGNTAIVMKWCGSKGAAGGFRPLTQAERHAGAAMIQARIQRLLSRFELAAVKAEYGSDFSGLPDLAGAAYAESTIGDIALIGDLMRHIYSGRPKRHEITDRYGLSERTFFRFRRKISLMLAEWEYGARIRLDDDFKKCGIIADGRQY